jgi:DNA-binding IclR family transcriptional regulator
MIAEETGLSKSAVHTALATLRRRELIASESEHATAVPRHTVLRHWRAAPGRKTKKPRG